MLHPVRINLGLLGLLLHCKLIIFSPGSGRSPGGGHGNPLQYSCLENPMGRGSLAGYRPWGHKESDMTEQLSTAGQTNHLHPLIYSTNIY